MAHECQRPAAPKLAKILLWLVLLLLYLPIAVMFVSSFVERNSDRISLSLRWFKEVFADSALMQALGNSLLVAICASSIATVVGTAAAVGMQKASKKVRRLLEGLSLTSLIFPEIVFALALLSWFFVMRMELGLTTVIIAHVTFSLSYVMMTVSSRLVSFDPSFEDAARDLGASEWQILKTIILPLLKPAILGGFILSFLLSFDDFLITYFVNGVGQDTLPVKLYTAMKMGVSPKLHALSSLMFLMTLAVLIFLFRSSSFHVLLQDEAQGSGNESTEKENL
ncbi:ABC transporter permease [Bdellovibrio sp. NC01]|uniref:ABC transporter permease n=1 Tax=Bdellovibrio sp. NC01 TaxID=2220073 RepID=UPI00115A1A4A|nr:ABC transporter permease [Bdellovibrio sp. NC01]QDK37285.1 ABC transporter permease [Bdellovibrio sp. NC01]